MESSTMFNGTGIIPENSTMPYIEEGPEYFKHAWIISQIFLPIMFLTCIWAITAFYKYGSRKGRWNRSNKEQFTLMLVATITPCVLILKLINSQVMIVIGLMNEVDESAGSACEVAIDISVALFALSLLPTYFYLWKRQQILYSQPFLRHLNTTFFKVLSYAAGIFILVADIGIAVLYINPNDYQMSEAGCVVRKDLIKPTQIHKIQSYLAAGSLVLSQLWIFALLVYPLRIKNTASVGGSGSTGPSNNLQKKLKRANMLAVVSMAICMLSDICAMILVTAVIPTSTPRCLVVTVYDFSLMINIFSLMLSHEGFKKTVMF